MQKALITGASSGIGLELAKLMASKGHDLVINSRDEEELNKIAKELEKTHGVSVEGYKCDLSKEGSADKLFNDLKNKDIKILINNAGFGYVSDFFESDLKRNQAMMHLNMVTLTELCHLFGTQFKKAGEGRILNIASIASFFPGPTQPVYYATKAYVRSFTRAIAQNLIGSGVSATVLHPGPTKTAFFREADAPNHTKGANPEDVAVTGYNAMMHGKSEIVHGLRNKFTTSILGRVIPYSWQASLVDKVSDI